MSHESTATNRAPFRFWLDGRKVEKAETLGGGKRERINKSIHLKIDSRQFDKEESDRNAVVTMDHKLGQLHSLCDMTNVWSYNEYQLCISIHTQLINKRGLLLKNVKLSRALGKLKHYL